MTTYFKIKDFDNLELLCMQGQSKSFPEHFHETFCISLINQGIECMKIGNRHIYSEKNYISITNPYEVHSNPLVASELRLNFDTIYLSQELVDRYAQKSKLSFEKRSFKNLKLNDSFEELVNSIKDNKKERISNSLEQFIQQLVPYSTENLDSDHFCFKKEWDVVFSFIEHNYLEKITIEDIAGIANMDKYNFAKKFKNTTGMSPINYILMKRIFAAKSRISISTDITSLSYDYNFSDLAHFSRNFKRFIGLSPKNYQKGLLI